MTPERFQLLNRLFDEAIELKLPARKSFIAAQIQRDAELGSALQRLISADAKTNDDLQSHEQLGREVHALLAGAPEEAAGTRIGRYVIQHVIGEGGFGTVFLATQTEPVRRSVALKIIKLGMDTRQVVARFEAERQALAMMNHPGIAAVLDGGVTPAGRPYFVMELVRGEPITRYCDEHALSVTARLELFIEVCRAVQHAHQKGVIHRDLKPSNVLVEGPQSPSDQDTTPLSETLPNSPIPVSLDIARVKIIDFGIAKAMHARLTELTLQTQARQLLGTPEYMSPEQVDGLGSDIDTRSDVYSLGVLLYEILTGVTPFRNSLVRSASHAEMQRIIQDEMALRPSSQLGLLHAAARNSAPKSSSPLNASIDSDAEEPQAERSARTSAATPRTLRRQLQGELDWIILKCLEKDRDRRYHTAHELAQDIQRFLENRPVTAGPPSVTYRVKKFALRHRMPIGAGAIVVLALIAGLTLAVLGTIRANTQADSASRAVKFLQDIIASSDPNRGEAAGTTVHEALDLASARLSDGSLKRHPGVEATIRRTLGSTYMAMGLYDKAAPHLEQAVALYRLVNGDTAPETAQAWNDLGELRRQLGDYAAAEPAYARALLIQSRHPPSIAAAQTLNNMGLLKQTQGKFEEAESLQRRSLNMRISVVGSNDQEVATSYNNLASLCVSMGQLEEAERLYRQALDMRLLLLGSEHWRVASTQISLSRLLTDRGEVLDAERLALSAVAVMEKSLGSSHAQTGRAVASLGRVRQMQGRLDEAGALFRRGLEIRRGALPVGHPEIAAALYDLGAYLVHIRSFAPAEVELREALEIRKQKLSPGHHLIAITESLLGEAMLGLGRLDEAEKLITDAHAEITSNPYSVPVERRKATDRLLILERARADAAR